MKKFRIIFPIMILFIFICTSLPAEVSVKLKDISFINGLKVNQVFGYGLVVGLQGTGDTKSPLTKSSLKNLLKNLGMEGDDFVSKNTAAVLITANLKPFSRIGEKVNITVSSIGDCKSLAGGILIQSPLKGADNRIYVVAQGSLYVSKSRGGQRSVKTVAAITGGGVVEREINPDIVSGKSIHLVLKHWDYSVANMVIKAISGRYPASKPEMAKSGKIKIDLVKGISLPEFISAIENIEITPSYKAKVVVNERSGTIVTGGNVKISKSMVSKEGVTVEITGGKKGAVSLLKDSSTVKDLVDGLNLIGASTRDIIAILKALHEAGALHAELVVK